MTLPPVLPLSLHRSRYPARQRDALLAALRQGRLPGDFLYASPSQAQRWLEYHQAFSPSRADPSVEEMYASAFREAASRLETRASRLETRASRLETRTSRHGTGEPAGSGRDGVAVVGLGAGGGRKDTSLLALLSPSRSAIPPAYVPIDVSPALVAEAALRAHAQCPDAEIRPLVADLSALSVEVMESLGREGLGPVELSAWLEKHLPARGKRVFTCFGMLPNMDHRTFPGWLAELLRSGDWLLISANLSPKGMEADLEIILPQYDNPHARRWYEGGLAELGFAGEDYSLSITGQFIEEPQGTGRDGGGGEGKGGGGVDDGAWRVRAVADIKRPVNLTMYGETVQFAEGDLLEVFHSNRFTAGVARNLLEGAGLRIQAEWIHASGEEGVFLCGV